MNEFTVTTEQLMQIIGAKEVEITLCRARITELVLELSKHEESKKESIKE